MGIEVHCDRIAALKAAPTLAIVSAPIGSTGQTSCQRAACGLPAAAVLPAAGALSASPVCSGPAAVAASAFVRALFSPVALGVFGGVRGCLGVSGVALGGSRNVLGGQDLNGTPHVLLSSCMSLSLC